MRIPHTQLSPVTLRAVVQAFVTGDGTRIIRQSNGGSKNVLRQLVTGRAELHFDDQSETCDIVPVEAGGNPPVDDTNDFRSR